MILYTPELKAAFAHYPRNSPRGGPVIPVRDCHEAVQVLKQHGLPVSDTVGYTEFPVREYSSEWFNGRRDWISSYALIEAGTEKGMEQYPTCVNEIATYNPDFKTLTIHCHDDKPDIGRGHWKGYLKGL